MSQLKAEVVRVEVRPHDNADRLDIIKVKGWQCVDVRGKWKSGDLAIYLPVDSILPEGLVKGLGIEKFYNKRLRTIKLRGALSQGLVAPLSILPAGTYPGPRGQERWPTEGHDFTELLGIAKYEEPIPVSMAGKLRPEHENFFKYTDIENIKNYPGVFTEGESVVVVEKIHGTNFRAAKIDGQLHVGSHKRSLIQEEGNLYWRAAKLMDLENTLQEGEEVFGEIYGSGVQDLNYGKLPGEISVAVFDIIKDKKFLDYPAMTVEAHNRGWFVAPEVAVLSWSSVVPGHAEGKSLLAPEQIREGVVIRPFFERYSDILAGRLIVKAISIDYLLRQDGTEAH